MIGSRHSTRRAAAFTVAELLIALALSTIVLLGALGMLTFVQRSNDWQADRYASRVDVRVTQLTVRRSLQSLVAGIPATEPPPEEDEDGQTTEEGLTDDVQEALDLASDGAAPEDQQGETQTPDELDSGFDPYSEPDYFELYFEEIELPDGTTAPVQRMILTLRESPVPDTDTARYADGAYSFERPLDIVRGAFEIRWLEERGWGLQWTPIEPAGEPTVLVDQIENIEWSVLPRDLDAQEWPIVHAAYLREDFPFVVRLVLWTELGIRADWAFETNVITRGSGT